MGILGDNDRTLYRFAICCLLATGDIAVHEEVGAIRPSAAKILETALGADGFIDITVPGLHSPWNHGMTNQFCLHDI